MKARLRTYLDLFRYYTLSREDYYQCMKKELPSTLYSMWHLSLLASFAMLGFAVLSYMAAFSSGEDIVLTVNKSLQNGVVFSTAIVIIILFGILVRYLYQRHKQGKTIRYMYIYMLGVFNYSFIVGIHIYVTVFSYSETPSILFAMFMICGLLLIFAPPLFNLSLILSAMSTFIIFAFSFMEPQYQADAIFNVIFATVVGIFFTWCINAYRAQAGSNSIKLEEEREKLNIQATTDTLTGLHNRRYFLEHANMRLQECLRNNEEASIILFDIDKFKSVNDTYGHATGDVVICAVSEVASSQLRPYDLIARYGGEEYIVFLPRTSVSVAQDVAERIRKSVEGNVINFQSVSLKCTISLGVAKSSTSEPVDLDELIAVADDALYRAKEGGRNRVETACPMQPT